jgi:prepilin-type N-terminal cleavage/methylation domain-containing protein
MITYPKQSGFSLVELSIVLVILGLLTGGILAGQSLIRAAELRSVSTEFNRYIAASQAFRDKYFAIPGDMNNATKFWGVVAGACATTVGTGTQTCDGDGNGQINELSATSAEMFRYWQHLANAGLIEGSYDGITHGSNGYSATTANSPVSKLSNSIWAAYYYGTSSAQSFMFDGQYDNSLILGGLRANNVPVTYVFKPEEAWNIDTKLDDGRPAIGKMRIRARVSDLPLCTTAVDNTTLTADYRLDSSTTACVAIFPRAL